MPLHTRADVPLSPLEAIAVLRRVQPSPAACLAADAAASGDGATDGLRTVLSTDPDTHRSTRVRLHPLFDLFVATNSMLECFLSHSALTLFCSIQMDVFTDSTLTESAECQRI